MSKTIPQKIKTIALIAHDNKKPDMMEWAKYNKKTLSQHRLIATGTTGKLLAETLSQTVQCLKSGPLGGDQQIGAKIAEGEIDLIIFFWDPLEPQPHDPDVKALLRLAVAWNVPTACNRSTADFIISSPLMTSATYLPQQPDFDAHNNRAVPVNDEPVLLQPHEGVAAPTKADILEFSGRPRFPQSPGVSFVAIDTSILDEAIDRMSAREIDLGNGTVAVVTADLDRIQPSTPSTSE